MLVHLLFCKNGVGINFHGLIEKTQQKQKRNQHVPKEKKVIHVDGQTDSD